MAGDYHILGGWRRRPDLNRGSRFCRPLPYHLATAPVGISWTKGVPAAGWSAATTARRAGSVHRSAVECHHPAVRLRASRFGETISFLRRSLRKEMERETGFEPATSTLARSHSTTELFPLAQKSSSYHSGPGQTTSPTPPDLHPDRHCGTRQVHGNRQSTEAA